MKPFFPLFFHQQKASSRPCPLQVYPGASSPCHSRCRSYQRPSSFLAEQSPRISSSQKTCLWKHLCICLPALDRLRQAWVAFQLVSFVAGLFLWQGKRISLSCVKEERHFGGQVLGAANVRAGWRTLKFPTDLRSPLEQLTLQVWCKHCFILFSTQPDIHNLFPPPGKLHSLTGTRDLRDS